MPTSRVPGVSSNKTYFDALTASQNVGPTDGGQLVEVSCSNEGGAAAVVSVSDGGGIFKKIIVPAGGNGEYTPRDGVGYNGQLSVSSTNAVHATVRTA